MINNEDGIALIITLFIMALMVTAILEFDFYTRINAKTAANFRDRQKAYYLAESTIMAARAILNDDVDIAVDSLDEMWATVVPSFPVGDGTISASMEDSGRKFNINSLITQVGSTEKFRVNEKNRDFFARLFTVLNQKEDLGLNEDVIDAIVDWLDPDDDEMPNGAEDDYYENLENPYTANNGPMLSLSELRLVKGISFGSYEVLKKYLTVFSNGPGLYLNRININTAEIEIIEAMSDNITRSDAQQILEARPFKGYKELSESIGINAIDIKDFIAYNSRYFLLYAYANFGNITNYVKAVIERTGGRTKLKEVLIN